MFLTRLFSVGWQRAVAVGHLDPRGVLRMPDDLDGKEVRVRAKVRVRA